MNIQMIPKPSIKIQFYFLIICFIFFSIFFIFDSEISMKMRLFFSILFLAPIWIIFVHYFRQFEITDSGIRVINILNRNIFITYNDLCFEIKYNSINQKCLIISKNKNNFVIYPWMTNFEGVIFYLKKQGKL